MYCTALDVQGIALLVMQIEFASPAVQYIVHPVLQREGVVCLTRPHRMYMYYTSIVVEEAVWFMRLGYLEAGVIQQLQSYITRIYVDVDRSTHCTHLFSYISGTCLELLLKAISIFISAASG